ncbi:MAG: thioredoxin family protein [Verrucomicrobiia bacterium]
MKRFALIVAIMVVTSCAHVTRTTRVDGTGSAPDTVTARAAAPLAGHTGETVGATNAATEHTASLNWESDYETALDKAKKDKKLVMLDVYTDWCGWCKILDRDTFSDEIVQEMLMRSFVAVKINPEKSQKNRQIEQQLGRVGLYPHIYLIDANGRQLVEIPGFVPAKQFVQQLDAAVKESAK